MRICIIGAGAGGITTAKHLLEEGFEVVVLEKREGFGGLWNVAEGVPSFALNMTATSSKTFLGFSDFPMGKQASPFPHSSEYMAYLERYARKFGVLERIRFKREVIRVRKVGQSWTVTARHEGQEETETFDAVSVCSGQHHIPFMPEYENAKAYTGELIHSSFVKSVERYKGKRVVVVGAGESGADYTHDLADVASATFLSLRRGIAVTKHFGLKGLPGDLDSTRAKVWLPRKFLHDFNVDCRLPDHYSAFKTLYILAGLPVLLLMLLVAPERSLPFLRSLFHKETWTALFRPSKRFGPASGIELSKAVAEVCQEMPGSQLEAEARAWKIKYIFDWYSGTMHNSQPFTKHNEFLEDIAKKKVDVVPGIKRYEGGNRIQFEDGRIEEVDAILFCTGFYTMLPFLEQSSLDGRELYKNTFMPGDPTLAFIGLLRPNVGALPPVAEMQARLFAGVLAGRIQLPPLDEMQALIAQDGKRYTEERPHHFKRLTSLVDYHLFMDELAGMLGVRPRLWTLILEPRMLFTFVFGPMGCFQYRLNGHGANLEAVKEALEDIPPVPTERVMQHAILALLMKPWFALLGWLGFRQFKPHF